MKRIYYILLTLLSIAMLSWILPWLVSLCFPYSTSEPFVGYSPVNDRIIVSVHEQADIPAGITSQYFDIDPATGQPDKSYTEEQRDSLLPEIFANQLLSKRLMPDSLKGEEMTPHNIRRNRWMFTSLPRNLNHDIPPVYPLMESMPRRFDLESPTVAMILPGHVEIIDIATNSIDTKKTQRFAKMFADRGFVFPSREASANVTTRKSYDNGYLLIDANNDLYHLKMQASRPSMARIERPSDITPRHVFVMENGDRKHYGIVTTEEGRTFAIARDDKYSLIELPDVTFNPEKERMSILKGLFAWTIKINDDKQSRYIVLDAKTYDKLLDYTHTYRTNPLDNVTRWIFPFKLTFTSGSDMMVYPRFSDVSWKAVFLNIVLTVFLAFFINRRRQRCMWSKLPVTLILGIFAFIPLVLIKR
ncbi:MAG: DUF4857 domain-containing protein [Clostridiales bacterium]|nr:DUF4857 domain-containing protein [Clostridiales bacterium]